MLKKWDLLKSNQCYSSTPLNVLEKTYKTPNKNNFKATVLQMPDWVNVIGINEQHQIILIKQYRFGTDKIELEIPGGVIDFGEKPIEAAKRELEEETGFKSQKFSQIGVVDANPAIQTNKCFTFLARDIKSIGTINFDPDEIIEFSFASIPEVKKFIHDGLITNAYIIAAFYWLSIYDELF